MMFVTNYYQSNVIACPVSVIVIPRFYTCGYCSYRSVPCCVNKCMYVC